MSQYCKRCKTLHRDNELCPHYLKQLKEDPSLLAEAANFTNIAGQYHLITSQSLDKVVQGVNKIAGTNLRLEGTHQYVRDVQVFNQLNVDSFSKSGVFSSAESAQQYYRNVDFSALKKKLNGTGQEVDWLRFKEGKLSSIFKHSKLLGEDTPNAPGVDGITLNRFTGEEISRTTIKAAEKASSLWKNTEDVAEALKAGTLDPNDILVGIDGTEIELQKALARNLKEAIANGETDYAHKLKQAQEQLKVQELNNTDHVKQSTNRLKEKMSGGEAYSSVTAQEVSKKAMQGAVIGAAVGLTISGITNYLKYKKGEISEKEAFQAVGQDTLKGSLLGGAISTVSIFLPAGVLGFAGGMAIGVYLNKTLTNILDEVFGKGAYLEILHASGFIYGMATSLEDSIKKIAKDEEKVLSNARKIRKQTKVIDQSFNEFDSIMKGDF